MKRKTGIWGCGNMAQLAHIPALMSLNNEAEIKVCADARATVAGQVAAICGAKCASSLDELLEQDIDLVYVLTPALFHLNDITRVLEAGKDVFCEKPLAMAADSVRQLKQIRQKTGKAVGVGYMKRYDANILNFMYRAAKKEWGELLFVRSHAFIGGHWDAAVKDLAPLITSDEAPPFDLATADPGARWMGNTKAEIFSHPFYGLLDTGCHSVNLLRFLTGCTPEVKRVTNKAGVRVVDFDFGTFTGTMEFCLNFAMNRWDEVTELYYTNASVRILTPPPLDRQSAAIVEIYSENAGAKELLTLTDNHKWQFRCQTADFLAALPEVDDLDDAEKDIAIMEDIYRKENK